MTKLDGGLKMTSKEALEILKNRLIAIRENNKIGCRRILEEANETCVKESLNNIPQIASDLELLDICYMYLKNEKLSEKAKERLKEWLDE